MRIDKIWSELENDLSYKGGLLLRRYSKDILPGIFVGITTPNKFRCLVLKVKSIITIDETNQLRDIKVEFRRDDNNSDFLLSISLVNPLFTDIFSTVCEDLIHALGNVNDEKMIIAELLNRLEKWILLFDLALTEGLSDEAQRGLFGEIFFIRKWLKNDKATNSKVLVAWLGPEMGIRDFQFDNWAIEVKTTKGNNHQKVHISSERQLDTSKLNDLFLYHLSLEALQASGETLNQLVEDIRSILSSDIASLSKFNGLLLSAGYFSQHLHQYDDIGYGIRQENTYKVANQFPRIEEKDLRDGVGDVKYSIIISNCYDYKISDDLLFNTIN